MITHFRFKKIAGFTLLEIMVSMTILSISVAGMLSALLMGRKNINVPDHRIAALNFAQQRIEDLKGKMGISGTPPIPRGRDELDGGTYNPDPVAIDPNSELAKKFDGERKYKVTNIGGSTEDDYHYKQVTVTVSWTEPD